MKLVLPLLMLEKAGISPKEKQKDTIRAVYDDRDGCVGAYWIQHKAFLFSPCCLSLTTTLDYLALNGSDLCARS